MGVGLGGGEYKTHSQQYSECKMDGTAKLGAWKTDTDVRWKTSDGKWHYGQKVIRSQEIICGRFGGECSNQNPGCKKLRNYDPTHG